MSFAIIQRCVLSNCGSNNINVCRKFGSVLLFSWNKTMFKSRQFVNLNPCVIHNNFFHVGQFHCTNAKKVEQVPESYTAVQMKTRTQRRKRLLSDELEKSGIWTVKALATAEEYNLERLTHGLLEQQLYIPNVIDTSSTSLPDVIHAVAKYEVEHEPREIFFFREGAVVMWNISDLESENVLQFLKKFEQNCYADDVVRSECEAMTYSYVDAGKRSHLKNGTIMLASDATNLDKYTFSNAMAQSVKLGIWEASLDHYVDSIAFVTEDLKAGKKIRLTQQEVLRKQGELFALRHFINLSSDLLDTPDFYWEQDDLEMLYSQICGYFSIAKRTRVINEKLNHCVELVGILSTHLSDRHHVRLEWMIIVLIMVEVAFETLHYIDRYLS